MKTNDSWLVLGVVGLASLMCIFTVAPLAQQALDVLAVALRLK